MGLKVLFIVVVIMLLLNTSCCGVQGMNISAKKKGWDNEDKLNFLNKQPIKTVQGVEGDIYECIDIHKQATLAHPLLKDHKIQMKPNFHLDGLPNEVSSKQKQSVLQFTGVDCPMGTIPVRRTQKQDLLRAKAFDKEYMNIHSYKHDYNRAILGCDIGEEPNFHGAHGSMNVLNPKVGHDEISYSLIWVENTNSTNFGHDYITAGWAVAPKLYGDFKTRFFTYWESTYEGKTVGCINDLCHGFVHVAPNVSLNSVITTVSVYGGDLYELSVLISQDKITKNWWLTIPVLNINVGYWPNAILPNLAIGATRVAFGGMTKASSNGISPQMGYGPFPDGDFKHSGYFKRIGVFDGSYNKTPPKGNIKVIEDAPQCYRIKNGHYQDENTQYVITYGGPGGKCIT